MELDEETAVMAKGAIWSNISNILVKLSGFVYTVLIARMATQSDVGLFYFGMGIMGIIGIFSDLGLTQSVIRYVPYHLGKNEREEAQRIATITVIFGTLFGVIGSIIFFVFARQIAGYFQNPPLEPVLQLFAIQLVVSQIYAITNALLLAMKKIKETTIASTIQGVLKLVFTFVLILSIGASASTLTIAFTLSYIVGAFFVIYYLKTALSWANLKVVSSRREYLWALKELVPFGITMVSISMFYTVMGYVDRIMIGYFYGEAGNAMIGIYSLAIGLAGMAAIFASSIYGIFYPLVSELVGKNDLPKVARTSATALRWVIYSSVPTTAYLCAFALPILRVLYGGSYEPGYYTLVFFSIGIFANYLGLVQRTALAGMRLVKIELIAVIIGATVNIILNFILIPPYGITGAAVSSMLGFSIMTIVNQYYANKVFGFKFPKNAWKNIFAGILVFLFLQGIEMGIVDQLTGIKIVAGDQLALAISDKVVKVGILMIFFFVGLAFYGVLLNIMRLFEHEDAQVFEKVLHKAYVPHWLVRITKRIVFFNQKEIV
ncbi:MAG TPA: flippase [Candidatus Micrarchaeota archaeon]|nr:flippase [Candidatus Micrarchaeota archaeon]